MRAGFCAPQAHFSFFSLFRYFIIKPPLYIFAGVIFALALSDSAQPKVQSKPPSPSTIGQQMEAFWQGKAHFAEMRDIDWSKPPYNAHDEGEGWFGKPMPFPDGKWYLFSRQTIRRKPDYCPLQGWRVIVRESSDQGRTWSNPATVAAAPGLRKAPDACGIVDGSSYYDNTTNTWQMLAQCVAAHNTGGWRMCHYTRRGSSPMGRFTADDRPAVRGGELWSRICHHPRAICDPRNTHDEGTPDIVYKKRGYFYVTFHGFDPATKEGFRGVAKTADFHHWIVAGPGLPDAPIFAPPECRAWNPGCIGGGEASTLIAGKYQYMMIETPSLSLACTPGQTWPIALLRAPKNAFPPWSSPLWQPFRANPLLQTAWPSSRAKCALQYPRWAVGANHTVYILYEDFDYRHAPARPPALRRRLLKLVAGGGPAVVLTAPPITFGTRGRGSDRGSQSLFAVGARMDKAYKAVRICRSDRLEEPQGSVIYTGPSRCSADAPCRPNRTARSRPTH